MDRDAALTEPLPAYPMAGRAADCADSANRALRLYARGFGQHEVHVDRFACPGNSDGQAGPVPHRAAVAADAITLPACASGVDARSLAGACVAHAIGHLRYSTPARPVGKRPPLLVAMLSLIEDARVERLMMRDYPGLRALWGTFHRASGERHAEGLSFAALAARLARALHDPAYCDPHHWVNKGRALIDTIGADLHDVFRFEEAASILANDLGQMRVRFDAQSYQIEPAYRDDNTFLWLFEDAEPVAAARADSGGDRQIDETQPDRGDGVSGASIAADPETATLLYPEWNYRSGTVREDWVAVVEGALPRMAPTAAHQAPLRSTRDVLHPKWRQTFSARRLKRQPEGDELDLDGMIDHVVAQRGTQAPDGRVFTRAGRQPRDASVLLLLDLSASTGRRVEGSPLSLLDCEKEAAEQIIAAFDGARHRIALHGFASNGRPAVHYVRLKEFSASYTAEHRQRLHALRPAWSTRFGAALRHAGRCLARETHSSKTIVLITDGEPSDIDVFDARYLIEDARHAVHTLAAEGIRTHCISLDPQANAAVRAIFGRANCATLARGTHLTAVIERVLAKVAA